MMNFRRFTALLLTIVLLADRSFASAMIDSVPPVSSALLSHFSDQALQPHYVAAYERVAVPVTARIRRWGGHLERATDLSERPLWQKAAVAAGVGGILVFLGVNVFVAVVGGGMALAVSIGASDQILSTARARLRRAALAHGIAEQTLETAVHEHAQVQARNVPADTSALETSIAEKESELSAMELLHARYASNTAKAALAATMAEEIAATRTELEAARGALTKASASDELREKEASLTVARAQVEQAAQELEQATEALQALQHGAAPAATVAPTEPTAIPAGIAGVYERTKDTTLAVLRAIRQREAESRPVTIDTIQAIVGKGSAIRIWLMLQQKKSTDLTLEALIAFSRTPQATEWLGQTVAAAPSTVATDQPVVFSFDPPTPEELLAVNTEIPRSATYKAKDKQREQHHRYVLWRFRKLGMPHDVLVQVGSWDAWIKSAEIVEKTIDLLRDALDDFEVYYHGNYWLFNKNYDKTLKPIVSILRHLRQNPQAKVSSADVKNLITLSTNKNINLRLLNDAISLADTPPTTIDELLALYGAYERAALKDYPGAESLNAIYTADPTNTLAYLQGLDADALASGESAAPDNGRRKRGPKGVRAAGPALVNLDSIRRLLPNASLTVQTLLAEIHADEAVSDELLKREAANLTALEGLGMEPDALGRAAHWKPLRRTPEDIVARAAILRAAVIQFDVYVRTNWEALKFETDTLNATIALLRRFYDGAGGAVIPADVIVAFAGMDEEKRTKLSDDEIRTKIARTIGSRRGRAKAAASGDAAQTITEARRHLDAARSWTQTAVKTSNGESRDLSAALRQLGEADAGANAATDTLEPLLQTLPETPGRADAVALQREIETVATQASEYRTVIENLRLLQIGSPDELLTQMPEIARALRLVLTQEALAQAFGRAYIATIQSHTTDAGFGSALRTALLPDQAAETRLDGQAAAAGPGSHAILLIVKQTLSAYALDPVAVQDAVQAPVEPASPPQRYAPLTGRALYNSHLRAFRLPENQLYDLNVLRDQMRRLAEPLEAQLEEDDRLKQHQGGAASILDVEAETYEPLDAEGRLEIQTRLFSLRYAAKYLMDWRNYAGVRNEIFAETNGVVTRTTLAHLLKETQLTTPRTRRAIERLYRMQGRNAPADADVARLAAHHEYRLTRSLRRFIEAHEPVSNVARLLVAFGLGLIWFATLILPALAGGGTAVLLSGTPLGRGTLALAAAGIVWVVTQRRVNIAAHALINGTLLRYRGASSDIEPSFTTAA